MMRIVLFVLSVVFLIFIVSIFLSSKTGLETDQISLSERLTFINLPALKTEGSALHIHQHLDIFKNGKKITVPSGIGIDKAEGIISPLHTHDNAGIIHVESDVIRDYTLGQFLRVWGVIFDKTDKIQVFVNGKKIIGDFQNIPLMQHQEIVIALGQNLPKSIPSTYSFPLGD